MQAEALHAKMLTEGIFFNLLEIDNVERPHPMEWSTYGVYEQKIDLAPLGLMERVQVIERYNIEVEKMKAQRSSVWTSVRAAKYIHSGDEFIWFEVEGAPLAVRWSSIESFQLI